MIFLPRDDFDFKRRIGRVAVLLIPGSAVETSPFPSRRAALSGPAARLLSRERTTDKGVGPLDELRRLFRDHSDEIEMLGYHGITELRKYNTPMCKSKS